MRDGVHMGHEGEVSQGVGRHMRRDITSQGMQREKEKRGN